MIELAFLILFPAIVAFLLLAFKNGQVRNAVVKIAAGLIGLATIILLITYFSSGLVLFSVHLEETSSYLGF